MIPRVMAYSAAILSSLVWALGTSVGYFYASAAFKVENLGCCHGPPERIAGALALIFPVVALAGSVWIVLSRLAYRRPGLALAAALVSLPIGLIFTFLTGLAETPL